MNLYQLKITLKYSRPPIWRRIQVSADTRLGELHDIIQTALGWTDDHLHQFTIGDTSYGMPDPHFPGDIKSERNIRLNRVAAEGDTLVYEYDFGDGIEPRAAGPGTARLRFRRRLGARDRGRKDIARGTG